MSERYQRLRRERERRGPRWPFVLSALLNLLLIALFARYAAPWLASLREPPRRVEDLQWVDLEPLPPQPPEQLRQSSPARGQIIENSRANDIEPDDSRYVADRAASYEQQTVGPRGAPLPGKKAEQQSAEPGSDSQDAPGTDSTEPGTEDEASDGQITDVRELFPTGEQIAKVLAEQRRKAAEAAANGGGGENALPLPVGESLDALDPNLPQGQFTLLNAKSFKYAGFIRRVGQRVFDQMLGQLYSRGFAASIPVGAQGYAIVETTMNLQGEQLSTRIYRLEGEPAYAEAARAAMVRGAWDLNPPSGVEADDGLIHWVLITRLHLVANDRYYGPQYRGNAQFGIL